MPILVGKPLALDVGPLKNDQWREGYPIATHTPPSSNPFALLDIFLKGYMASGFGNHPMVAPNALTDTHFVRVIEALRRDIGQFGRIESIEEYVDIRDRGAVNSVIVNDSGPSCLNVPVLGQKPSMPSLL
ncbi:hypothetical protein PGQ11_010184 [Apiospora arundinis]|uniref:Uncharacterized protein n=1 Tax=Apiospora arundinis TaxID=335852 RepID=A0ABR2I930_9PEZI